MISTRAMEGGTNPRRVVRLVPVVVLVAVAAFPQSQPAPPQSADEVKAEAAKLYGDAHPYLDAPFPELEKTVHELSGMTPASSQSELPDLLEKVGAKVDELLQGMPDLQADEQVDETQRAIPKGEPPGCVGLSCAPLASPGSSQRSQEFRYRILTHAAAFGRTAAAESRTMPNGKPVEPTADSPKFQGFLAAWALFYPVNQVESRFRYLGRQPMDGRSTFVIGFAQRPGAMDSLARPILLQGIAWVDSSDFRIVRLRTDLLAPLPERNLLQETASIIFGPAEVTQPELHLWLPMRAEFEMEANGQFFHEEHKYSGYRVYKAATDRGAETANSAIRRPGFSAEAKEEAAEEVKLYASAQPYIEEPPSELRKTVHELAGLTPAAGQETLPDLLGKTGAKADELLRKVPDLISDESVTESSYAQGMEAGCVGVGCSSPGAVAVRDESFHYMILTHPTEGGPMVSEYRTTRKGRAVEPGSAGAPVFQGFVSAWVVFSSANQGESRFRYLGQQRMDGRDTYVVGFAQTPGAVESPGEIVVNGELIPMLLQGIAWIDSSDFRIVRLRIDLLAPLPLILVANETANLVFGPVHIADLGMELWLPRTVSLQMEVRGQVVREEHKYSKYRLYKAKSRIILSPSN
jgi:hypothetical protein